VRYINNYFVEKICGFLAATHIPKSSESLFVSLQRVHCRFDLAFQFRVVYTFNALFFHFYVPELENRVPYRLPFSSAYMEDKSAKRFSFNNFFQNFIMFMDRRQVCVYSFVI